MKTNYHSHTMRCKHAKGTDEEYVYVIISLNSNCNVSKRRMQNEDQLSFTHNEM